MFQSIRDALRSNIGMLWEWCCWLPGRLADLGHYCVAEMAGALLWWYYERDGRYLASGLPAALLAGGVLVLAIFIGQDRQVQQIASYRGQAVEAVQARNFPTAQVAFRRLIELDPQSPEFRFGFATVAEAIGESARTAAIMDELAPLNWPGYGPAHLWQARHWLRATLPSAIKQRFAEIHLYRAVQAQPENLEAHALLGQLLLDNGQLVLAEKHLTKAFPKKPEVGLALARVYAARGAKSLAITTAEQAESFFRQHAEASIDNHQARLLQAEAALFLEKYAVAAAILKEGQRLGGPAAYPMALGTVYVRWATALAEDRKSSPDARLALIQEGLLHDPNNLVMLQQLLDIANVQSADGRNTRQMLRLLGDRLGVLGMVHGAPTSQEGFQLLRQAAEVFRFIEANRARSTVRRLLARGTAPAISHLALGADAWERGKPEEARAHYEQAYQLDPNSAPLMNNLAMVLAGSSSAHLSRALEMMNFLVERCPDQPQYRMHRGEIMMRMDRWREAIVDLEGALPALPGNKALHRDLAETYQRLKLPEMAAEHLRLADDAANGKPGH